MATTIADLVVKIGADIKGFQNSVKQMENEFSGIVNAGEKMKAIGGTLTTYVTAPILAAAGAAIKMAADVDKGVSEVITLFGLTGTEAEAMSKKMKEGIAGVSNEVGIAQTVITEGLYNAISAGVPEENVFDFMRVASQAAIAGVTDVNTAVDGITTAINAYGLSAEDAERVSDSMFATVQGGKTTFGELSAALFNVAPAAAAAGVSMEEVNAGIATLTASGVPTSVATTQLRAALTGLQRPSEDLNKIFKDLGYESAQVAIESEGLGFALDAVKKASNGNNGELQKLLGSTEAVAAANVIAGTGAEKFADELDRQAKAAGSTQKAFDVMQKSTAQQFQKTTTMLQNIAIALGDKLLPLFNSFLEVVQDVLLWFSELSDGWQNAIVVIGGIAAAVGPVLIVLGKLATLMPTIAAGFTLLTGPIGLVIAAIAALTAAAVAIYSNWDGLVVWFEDLWYKIKMAHLVAAREILTVVQDLFSWIPGSEAMFAGLSSTINGMIDGAQIEREAQLAERAVNAAAAEAGQLATEAGTAGDNLADAGTAGTDAGAAILAGMEAATGGVKSLNEQVADILEQMGAETEAGKRELAFLMKLDGKTALETEIEEIEQALAALANDTTISIDDQRVLDLQTSLTDARTRLDNLNKADIFKQGVEKAFDELASKAGELTTSDLVNLETKIAELGTQAKTAEDFKAIVALNSSLANAQQAAVNAETGLEDFFALADDDLQKFAAMNAFEQEIADINANLTGENALQAKIDAVWTAVGNGTIPLGDGEQLVEAYRQEMDKLNSAGTRLITGAGMLASTYLPNVTTAFNSGKTAVGDFKNAFNGNNGKTFFENLGSGFGNVSDAINSTKAMMNDFGTASGAILGALDLAVPGLGSAIMGLSSVFEALGIDVSGALNSISDAIANFFTGNQNMGPMTTAFQFLDNWYNQIMDKTMQFGGDWEALFNDKDLVKNALAQAKNWEDFMEKMAAALDITIDQAKQVFTQQQEQTIKNAVWAGQYDPNTGVGATVSEELKAEIFKMISDLKASGNFSNQEILDMLIAKYTKTPLITLGIAQLLGLPALAQGGLIFGPLAALVGDNPNAGSDPEIISPLSKLNEMLVQPVLSQISSMMGGAGGMQQVVYVNLDGRVIAESVFYNMPDVVRVNTGGLQ